MGSVPLTTDRGGWPEQDSPGTCRSRGPSATSPPPSPRQMTTSLQNPQPPPTSTSLATSQQWRPPRGRGLWPTSVSTICQESSEWSILPSVRPQSSLWAGCPTSSSGTWWPPSSSAGLGLVPLLLPPAGQAAQVQDEPCL